MEDVTVHMVSNRNPKSRLLPVIDGWMDETIGRYKASS